MGMDIEFIFSNWNFWIGIIGFIMIIASMFLIKSSHIGIGAIMGLIGLCLVAYELFNFIEYMKWATSYYLPLNKGM